jgi:hypothetical protein
VTLSRFFVPVVPPPAVWPRLGDAGAGATGAGSCTFDAVARGDVARAGAIGRWVDGEVDAAAGADWRAGGLFGAGFGAVPSGAGRCFPDVLAGAEVVALVGAFPPAPVPVRGAAPLFCSGRACAAPVDGLRGAPSAAGRDGTGAGLGTAPRRPAGAAVGPGGAGAAVTAFGRVSGAFRRPGRDADAPPPLAPTSGRISTASLPTVRRTRFQSDSPKVTCQAKTRPRALV